MDEESKLDRIEYSEKFRRYRTGKDQVGKEKIPYIKD